MVTSHPALTSTWNAVKLRDAQGYLEKAKTIDPNNVVALTWLQQVGASSNQLASFSHLLFDRFPSSNLQT